MRRSVWAVATVLVCGCGVQQALWGEPVPQSPPVLVTDPPASALDQACATTKAGPIAGDPRSRQAAQRGLDFIAADTIAWQNQHNCYGCHVQAVTLEALVIGQKHHFGVRSEDVSAVMRGMMELPGGAHSEVGFSVGGASDHLYDSSQSFGGSALALYDEHNGEAYSKELLATAERLLAFQQDHGGQSATEGRLPIGAGTLQATMQAAQTWRQAHARSADERWLVAVAKAEAYLRTESERLRHEANANLQYLDYALLGLHAAGAHANDDVVATLLRAVRARQGQDGGFGFHPNEGGNPFATGQALYVLKRWGASDADPAVARGTAWLIAHQGQDGSWSGGGDRRGEAMWGVLGLVSQDVVSLQLAGLQDGQHIATALSIAGKAVDNGQTGVSSVEFLVDDVPLARACASTLAATLDPAKLAPGVHHLDLVATTGAGERSRTRVEFYAGDHFVTREASHWDAGQTHFSWRNVAPAGQAGQIAVEIHTQISQDGQWVEGPLVHSTTLPATSGPMHYAWSGPQAGEAGDAGAVASEHHRYSVTLAFVDAAGKRRQVVSLPFVHDTPAHQRQNFAEVQGQLDLATGGSASNADVELVDKKGRVIQRVKSTRSGRYRFKNVDAGEYDVRVRREGFEDLSAPVQAAPETTSESDLKLELSKSK